MKKFLLLTTIIFSQILFAQNNINDEKGLNFINELLNAESIADSNEIASYDKMYTNILAVVKEKTENLKNNYAKYDTIFNILHAKYLKRYSKESKISDLFQNKNYNCLTSTCLYYALCKDLGLKINIYGTSGHVYASVPGNDSSKIIVEMTDPAEGFDFGKNEDDYLEYLLEFKIITRDELKKKTVDEIYNEYIEKSVKVNGHDLVSLYYGNLGAYAFSNNDMESAFHFYQKSIMGTKDSLVIAKYSLIWTLYSSSLAANIIKLNSFLNETLIEPAPTKEIEDNYISSCAMAIDENLDNGDIASADTLYSTLVNDLHYHSKNDPTISTLYRNITIQIIIRKMTRGEYQEGLDLAKVLYDKYKNNSNIQDLYINAAREYIANKMILPDVNTCYAVADRLYKDLPQIKSVQDIYALAILVHLSKNDYCLKNKKESKALLFNAYKKLKDNAILKKAITHFYHVLAMDEVKKNNYNTARKYVRKGLVYNSKDDDLNKDLKELKELPNSNKSRK